jgi:O-antigen chain-terminating methyltransferase
MKLVLQRAFLRLARALGIPVVQSRLNELDARLTGAISRLEERDHMYAKVVEDRVSGLFEMLGRIDASIEPRVMRLIVEATERIDATADAVRSHLEREIAQVRLSQNVFSRTGTEHSRSADVTAQKKTTTPVSDKFYMIFENYFRGSRELVRERQDALVDSIVRSVDGDHPLLDIGCGRGEWLEILRSRSIPARGIDLNRSGVEECRSHGLDVAVADGLGHLSSLEEGSLGAVTMFQVLEHLPFADVTAILVEARRVLRPGGVFLGEIPNAMNVTVGASSFWIDPTHERPLHPEVLRFLALQAGFSRADVHTSSPIRPSPDLSGLDKKIAEPLGELYTAVFGPADAAIIAYC